LEQRCKGRCHAAAQADAADSALMSEGESEQCPGAAERLGDRAQASGAGTAAAGAGAPAPAQPAAQRSSGEPVAAQPGREAGAAAGAVGAGAAAAAPREPRLAPPGAVLQQVAEDACLGEAACLGSLPRLSLRTRSPRTGAGGSGAACTPPATPRVYVVATPRGCGATPRSPFAGVLEAECGGGSPRCGVPASPNAAASPKPPKRAAPEGGPTPPESPVSPKRRASANGGGAGASFGGGGGAAVGMCTDAAELAPPPSPKRRASQEAEAARTPFSCAHSDSAAMHNPFADARPLPGAAAAAPPQAAAPLPVMAPRGSAGRPPLLRISPAGRSECSVNTTSTVLAGAAASQGEAWAALGLPRRSLRARIPSSGGDTERAASGLGGPRESPVPPSPGRMGSGAGSAGGSVFGAGRPGSSPRQAGGALRGAPGAAGEGARVAAGGRSPTLAGLPNGWLAPAPGEPGASTREAVAGWVARSAQYGQPLPASEQVPPSHPGRARVLPLG